MHKCSSMIKRWASRPPLLFALDANVNVAVNEFYKLLSLLLWSWNICTEINTGVVAVLECSKGKWTPENQSRTNTFWSEDQQKCCFLQGNTKGILEVNVFLLNSTELCKHTESDTGITVSRFSLFFRQWTEEVQRSRKKKHLYVFRQKTLGQ